MTTASAPGTSPGPTDAAKLLRDGHCTPQCLLAREPGPGCACRCHGHYHGALLTAPIPTQTGTT
jgi:hypothetical protein